MSIVCKFSTVKLKAKLHLQLVLTFLTPNNIAIARSLRMLIESKTTEKIMPDDKSKRGNPDRKLVSANERYEVEYLARKVQLPEPLVKKVIQQEGPSRKAVESYLNKMKRNAR